MLELIIGLVLFGIGEWCLYSHKKFFKNSIIVQGIVSSHEPYRTYDSDGHKTTMYKAVVSFSFEGETHKVTSKIASNIPPKIGKFCKVGVNPTDMQDVRIDETNEKIFDYILIGFGIFWIAMGLIRLF